MKELKASEVLEAINNDVFVDDLNENQDMILLIQDASDLNDVKVTGAMNGAGKRLSCMLADRMVKNVEFREVIHDATMLLLEHQLRRLRGCVDKVIGGCSDKDSE